MSLSRAETIKEGDRVEVINLGPGFEHSYYAAMVISPVHHGRCRICYEKVVMEDDETQLLEEEVLMVKLSEIVDEYWNDGWWLGRIVHKDGEPYVTRYEEKSHHVYAFQDIRLHQEWF